MNIFVLNTCPVLAAQDLCDEHISKMLVESCQLLATCFTLEQLASNDCPRTINNTVRKHYNPNNRFAKWVKSSKANMQWLITHTKAMEKERLERSFSPHYSYSFVEWVEQNIDKCSVPDGYLTPFIAGIPENAKCRKVPHFNTLDVVTQYRLYYIYDKPFATWKRIEPEWFRISQSILKGTTL